MIADSDNQTVDKHNRNKYTIIISKASGSIQITENTTPHRILSLS